MFSIIKKSLIIICLFFLQKIKASEKLNFRIEIPENLDVNKIQIMIDDGLGEKIVSIRFTKNIAFIRDDIESTYATILILYAGKNGHFYGPRILINSKSVYVIFAKESTMQNPLESYILKNAIDVDRCKEYFDLKSYCRNEFETNSFYAKQYSMLHTDSSTLNYNNSSKQLALKAMGYIKKHGKKYFSFWYFRMNIANELLKTNQLELYEIFNTAFPAKFQESFEGKKLKSLLEGNLFVKKGNAAPSFAASDYMGNIISLDSLRGQYVLLSFWATWCKPCLAEIPILKQIRKEYPEKKLSIISVSCDKDSAAFIKKITELKMNWTHIFGNNNLQNTFGNKPIPALYLIDSKGIIIFSRWEDEEIKLQEILKENVGNR